MLVHDLYPIGATVKHLHTGAIATIKNHGIAAETDEGETLDLFMAGCNMRIWKTYNVEVLDTPNTAEVAYSFMQAKQRAGIIGYTVSARVAFESLVNVFMPTVKRISIGDGTPNLHADFVVDFNDGSLLVIKLGDWAAHGFYAQIQDKRC